MRFTTPSRWFIRRAAFNMRRACLIANLTTALVMACALCAQTPQTPQTPTAAPKAKKPLPRQANPAAQAATPVEAATASSRPETPHWPVNDTPRDASITWDSHGLKIAATNSSLRQILNEVSTETGAKVEGLATDERVFGDYGPGLPRDVLSQLLNGSGYNVLLIGDQGEGTPRQIVLSARHTGNNPSAANRPSADSTDDEAPEQPESEEQPQQIPLINRPPSQQGGPGAPRSPQQVLQELQQRQQQMQDQQQQQQPQGPPEQQQPPH